MKKSRIKSQVRKSSKREPKRRGDAFTSVGVRLIDINNTFKTFTYKARVPLKFRLGELVVVETSVGYRVGAIVRIDVRPRLVGNHDWKWLRYKVVELHVDPDDGKRDSVPTFRRPSAFE